MSSLSIPLPHASPVSFVLPLCARPCLHARDARGRGFLRRCAWALHSASRRVGVSGFGVGFCVFSRSVAWRSGWCLMRVFDPRRAAEVPPFAWIAPLVACPLSPAGLVVVASSRRARACFLVAGVLVRPHHALRVCVSWSASAAMIPATTSLCRLVFLLEFSRVVFDDPMMSRGSS